MSVFPPNATLTFKLPDGAIATDEYGNANPENLTATTMQVYLVQKTMGREEVLGGWDSREDTPIQGYAVSPNRFPAEFRHNSIVDCQIEEETYCAKIAPKIISNPLFEEVGILGQAFTGVLLVSAVWGGS